MQLYVRRHQPPVRKTLLALSIETSIPDTRKKMQSPPDHEDEVKFAKALVNPEKDSRDQTLAKLRKYVASIKTFDDMEMLKLWKALYYTMWLSDKQPIQVELAQSLTDLTQVFSTVELQLLYIRMFFRILLREWFHLDQYRVNKFYTLVRMMFRNVLAMIAKAGWDSETAAQLISIVDEEVLQKKPNGVRFHIADIFLPELHNVSGGKINTKDFLIVFRPFLNSVLRLDDNNVFIARVYKEVLFKYASHFAAELATTADASEETPALLFAAVKTKVLQKVVFDLAAEEETPNVCRKKLYELHKAFAATTKSQFITESLESLLAADATLTKSSVAAAAKKDKKKTAAVAVPEPVVEAVKEVAKKEKKVEKADKTEKKAEKAVPVVEKTPVAAVESTKKKSKRPASELLEQEETEAVPVPVVSKKDKKDKVKKTEETPASTKTEKNEKSEKSEKPKEKKAKVEAKTESAPATPAEPAKADTPPPQYIASAKFAGRKPGYAFKKGASGLGYYWDAVQARKNSRASLGNGATSANSNSGKKQVPNFHGKNRK